MEKQNFSDLSPDFIGIDLDEKYNWDLPQQGIPPTGGLLDLSFRSGTN